jgi:hypothetical protein
MKAEAAVVAAVDFWKKRRRDSSDKFVTLRGER